MGNGHWENKTSLLMSLTTVSHMLQCFDIFFILYSSFSVFWNYLISLRFQSIPAMILVWMAVPATDTIPLFLNVAAKWAFRVPDVKVSDWLIFMMFSKMHVRFQNAIARRDTASKCSLLSYSCRSNSSTVCITDTRENLDHLEPLYRLKRPFNGWIRTFVRKFFPHSIFHPIPSLIIT